MESRILSVSSLIPIKSHVSASPASFWCCCATVSLVKTEVEVEAESASAPHLFHSVSDLDVVVKGFRPKPRVRVVASAELGRLGKS